MGVGVYPRHTAIYCPGSNEGHVPPRSTKNAQTAWVVSNTAGLLYVTIKTALFIPSDTVYEYPSIYNVSAIHPERNLSSSVSTYAILVSVVEMWQDETGREVGSR